MVKMNHYVKPRKSCRIVWFRGGGVGGRVAHFSIILVIICLLKTVCHSKCILHRHTSFRWLFENSVSTSFPIPVYASFCPNDDPPIPDLTHWTEYTVLQENVWTRCSRRDIRTTMWAPLLLPDRMHLSRWHPRKWEHVQEQVRMSRHHFCQQRPPGHLVRRYVARWLGILVRWRTCS